MSLDHRPARDLGAHRHLVVSERLRERRRDLGLTQKEVVARLRRMGVATTNKALSSLEHGAGLDVAKLPELACALECTLTYLVGLTDTPDHWQPDGAHWPAPALQARPARPHPGDGRRPVEGRAVGVPRIIGPVTTDWTGEGGH
jgi:transcriptional regulator with XRE-family HTH domain